jgi:hypothetical protein
VSSAEESRDESQRPPAGFAPPPTK